MLGGMLGLYDSFQKPAGMKYSVSSVVKRMSVSLPTSIVCMAGYPLFFSYCKGIDFLEFVR